MKIRSEHGFSLLELLLVMAVIAIIVAVALPSFRGMRNEASVTKAEGELNTLNTAVESYFRHTNAVPASLNNLYTASPAIVTRALSDPFKTAGTTYKYVNNFGTDGAGNAVYIVYSKGPDGVDTLPTVRNDATSQVYVELARGADEIVVSNVPVIKL
jgi:prepilin-type N-terminal cleavage/methylation domain-containing protein